ncbi:glycosyltransferase [Pedococcus sp. NPDC057267]|uniref:glycosyltransferase n=1 Tax=Pedococcus sp. NPDC057267 TaxID=3346077 RepID=UPI0036434EB4
MSRIRTLIFIVAYNAESTLSAVLDRIPREVLRAFDCEVLVIDDASSDRTFSIGHDYAASHPELPVTVLRNPANQGYGGNQKLGYSYALSHGFDVVALIHGDGQYAPEELPRLLQPFVDGTADVVFGSRMLSPGAARRGGMPLYKYVGNRILSTVQNRLTGSALSEWHSGYRLYSTKALRTVRFDANDDGFPFDTEIILQLLNADQRIAEMPIPTFYGDEICRVEGMRYAWQVMLATTRNALHRRGVLHSRRLQPIGEASNGHYDLKLGYRSSHTEALRRTSPGTSVLDLGAGPGAFATVLADSGVTVTAADKFRPTVVDPRVRALTMDLNAPLDLPLDGYDQVLLLDVIEHLNDPEGFLSDLRYQLGPEPTELILTTPNIAFVVTRAMLGLGQFNYGNSGILDRTHTRLFTARSLRSLVGDAGFRIDELVGIPAPFPKVLGDGWLGRGASAVNAFLIRLAPRMFSYQLLVRATSRPHADHLLTATRDHTATLVA